MILVTLHGGNPDVDPHLNNIHAYDKDGMLLTDSVLLGQPELLLNELRSIGIFNGLLYVVNANRARSGVLCYQGKEISYHYCGNFVSQDTCPAIVHPFDFAFDGAGHCYVSSQDTNVVTRLMVSGDGQAGTPAPLAPALPAGGTFLPGTFVASSAANLCGLPTTPVPVPLGLEYSDDGKKKHSVRGLAWANNSLYVVDQPSGTVKVYNSSGQLVGQSNQVETPVHIAAHDGRLYVTGANRVLTARIPSPPGNFTLSEIHGLHIPNSSGMAFTESGNVYIATRTENSIAKFDADFRPLTFRCSVPDNPEFLLHL